MGRRCVVALLLFLAAAGLPAAASGTILRPFDLAGLSREAHAIVRGRVVGQEARRDAESGRIYTYSTVDVLEVVKGAPDLRRVTVKQLGGTVGEWAVRVAGTAELAVSEEVVLFLRLDEQPGPTGEPTGYLVGMHQGKFGVRRDERSAWVTRTPLRVDAARAGGSEPAGAPGAPAIVAPAPGGAALPAVPPEAVEDAAAARPALDAWLSTVRRHVAEAEASGTAPDAAPDAAPGAAPGRAPGAGTVAP